jgi:stage V sporulation protein AC
VPVTGFANGVAATAHGFQVEGQVFGVGARIFQIAGPVILYGVFTSWILGLGYWILGLF